MMECRRKKPVFGSIKQKYYLVLNRNTIHMRAKDKGK